MATLAALAGIGAGYLLIRRSVDLRRLDDPFAVAFVLFSVLWVAGLGFGQRFPTAPQVMPSTVLLVIASFAAFIAGGVIARTYSRGQGEMELPQSAGQTEQLGTSLPTLAMVLVLGWVLVAFFLVHSGGIPVLSASGEQARVTARAGLGYLIIPAIWFVTFPTVVFVARAYHQEGRWRHAIWGIVASSAFALATLGNRAPVLVLLLAAGWVAITAKGRLPRVSWLAAAAAVSLLGLAFAAMLRAGEPPSVGLAVDRVGWLAYVNDSNLQRVLTFIPAHTPYLLGRGYLIDLSVLAPGPQPNFSLWLKEMMGLQFAGGGITVGLTGESYANWGPWIAVALSLVAGAVLSQVRPRLHVRSLLDRSFVVLFALAAAGIVQSGITSVLLYSLVPLTAVYVGLRVLGIVFAAPAGNEQDDPKRSTYLRG